MLITLLCSARYCSLDQGPVCQKVGCWSPHWTHSNAKFDVSYQKTKMFSIQKFFLLRTWHSFFLFFFSFCCSNLFFEKKKLEKIRTRFCFSSRPNETKVELISSTFFVWPDFSWAAAALLPPPARTGPGRSPPASSTTTTTILFREKATPAEKKSNDV